MSDDQRGESENPYEAPKSTLPFRPRRTPARLVRLDAWLNLWPFAPLLFAVAIAVVSSVWAWMQN